MAGINTGKVLIGGLVAGACYNVGDFLINTQLMASDMQTMVNRLHLDPNVMTSMSGMVPWIVIDFLMGILVLFVYAAMRPRFGPGPKTAIIAGGVLFIGVSLVIYGFTTMGIFAMDMFAKNTAYEAVNIGVGTIVGAWLYKE